MSVNEEIWNLTQKLKEINIQQGALLAQLDVLIERRTTSTNKSETRVISTVDLGQAFVQEPPAPDRPVGSFKIGDKVTIANPTGGETKATVYKINRSRASVVTETGKKYQRAPKNLILDKGTEL